ncbi:hypothetical protein [Streptomyces sp. MI02-7b]|uniref:hypothetical protein n=1 Tax=Streptomyces sp. MI02-7b TaxID=462941 RepID=UPI0029AB360A|nr:hypothetical protein [Streptomyces sp. MI02-7b]MDX3078630.1 hypothetical protein [Streptomyces sp. MI02-7b]
MGSIPAFALHLGGGLYVDSWGNLYHDSPDYVPAYHAPTAVPIDPSKIAEALKQASTLKDINKDKGAINLAVDLGIPPELLDILSAVGKIAGFAGPVGSALSLAFDLAKLVGIIKEGPNALEVAVEKMGKRLNTAFHAFSMQEILRDVAKGRSNIQQLTAEAAQYLDIMDKSPTKEDMETRRGDIELAFSRTQEGFGVLLSRETWMTMVDWGTIQWSWGRLWQQLFTLPEKPGGAPRQATLPEDNGSYFDNCLMVPSATYAATGFLTAIRAIEPEYRTTGRYKGGLQHYARMLDDLAEALRDNGLALTRYKPEHFLIPLNVGSGDVYADPFSGKEILNPTGHWPVGALDLRYHNDEFFAKQRESHPGATKLANMDFGWTPPAILQPGLGGYVIVNPQECADAANSQAEKDYAELLATSGYVELLLLAALFRNEWSAPSTSQTVRPGKLQLTRKSSPRVDVSVSTKDIPGTGVITSPAKREHRECYAAVSIKTQPTIPHGAIQYKVKLRTLSSMGGTGNAPKSWSDVTYDQFQMSSYEPVPNPNHDPELRDLKQLVLTETSLALDEYPLVPDWTSSPGDPGITPRSDLGEVTADTFDWWIPVPDVTVSRGKPGKMQPMNTRLHMVDTQARKAHQLDARALWPSGEPDWDGQHRDVARTQVKFDYTLDWTGNTLEFTLHSQPPYRSYIVWLVIEEKMLNTGQILHTAVEVPVNGLLTYVPEEFFAKELLAYSRLVKVLKEFNREIKIQNPNGPDPLVIDGIHAHELASHEILDRSAKIARRSDPHLWDQVMNRASRGQ